MHRVVCLLLTIFLFVFGCRNETSQDMSATRLKPKYPAGTEGSVNGDAAAASLPGLWNWEGNYLDVYHYAFRDDGTVSKYVITKAQEDGRWQIGQDGKLYVTFRDGKETRVYRIESPTQIMDEAMEWTDDIDFPWTKVDAVRFPVGHRTDDLDWTPPRQITMP